MLKKSYSGKIVLRMRPELHKNLSDESKQRAMSLNQVILEKITQKKSKNESIWSDEIKKMVKIFRPVCILLFGSCARNQETADSDIDFLFIMPKDQPIKRELYRKFDEFFFEINKKFSPHFVHLPEFEEISKGSLSSLWPEVALDGITLYQSQKTEAVQKFLQKIKEMISLGKIKKRMNHGLPYWTWIVE